MSELVKLVMTTFTDPMMGLSYECEPVFRKLETHFPGMLEFRYVMAGLVRDVHALLDPDDLRCGEDFAIRNYNRRLARIYESEEDISGMPVNMVDFHLFSTEHISSLPLNLAYKAAQLACPEKADLYLYNLRYATIVDCKPTTHWAELLEVARSTGIDAKTFAGHYTDGSAQKALEGDLAHCRKLGIRTLPAYMLAYGDNSMVVQQLIGYNAFAELISELSEGLLQPRSVTPSLESIRQFIAAHPLISPIELFEAYDFASADDVVPFLKPLLDTGCIARRHIPPGVFITKI